MGGEGAEGAGGHDGEEADGGGGLAEAEFRLWGGAGRGATKSGAEEGGR